MYSRAAGTVARPLIATMILLSLALGAASAGNAQQDLMRSLGDELVEPARVWQGTFYLPAYPEGPPDPNPPFELFDPSRINYPYTMRNNVTDRRVAREWRALFLENEYLRCTVLPDIGGHLYSCTDKLNGAEMFYDNPSLKLAQIAYRGAWAAFGIEFNFPVSHNWMTVSPVDFAMTTNPDGSASAWVGNIDRVTGMQWRVELRLQAGRAVLEQHTTLYNRGDVRHRFYWWTNAGVRVEDDSRIVYPMRHTASHGFRDVDTWPIDSRGTDLTVYGNHVYGPVSRFAHGSREPWMAVIHPRTQSGVVHYSSPTDLPAKKIWSWGSDPDGLDWRQALSDDDSAYVEVQAGVFRNQETYGFLEPQDSLSFSEYWMPVRGLAWISRAVPDAILHLERSETDDGSSVLDVRLNVTRKIPDTALRVLRVDGEAGSHGGGLPAVATHHWDLDPATVVAFRAVGLDPETDYRVEVLDGDGERVIAQTEGVYAFTPSEEITVGPVVAPEVPGIGNREDGDWLAVGDDLERNGRRLEALRTYEEGLKRSPSSVILQRAAGRLQVGLKRFVEAIPHLDVARERVSSDRETAYYQGLALLAAGRDRAAREALEFAQSYGTWRSAALIALAGLESRGGDPDRGLALLREAAADRPEAVRPVALEVSILRALERDGEARDALGHALALDPTSSSLRYEGVRLGVEDDPAGLWAHLAADPERLLEVAVEHLRLGLYTEVVTLLERAHPDGPEVVSEPAMPQPGSYPLIAYYRGYARSRLGGDPGLDFAAAAAMSTTYVFPNRPDTLPVLLAAIEHDAADATAHFLLGSWYLSGGRVTEAMASWETARSLEPTIPALHRNLGRMLLHAEPPDLVRAIEVLLEGMEVDPLNPDLYFAIDDALTAAGRDAAERADVLSLHPDLDLAPATLVYRLARALAGAGRFDEAEDLFTGRFFPRREGGINVREVWLDVRVARAVAAAGAGACGDARTIVESLDDTVEGLPFTRDGLEPFLSGESLREGIDRVDANCPTGL